MRRHKTVIILAILFASPLAAQQPDLTRPLPFDSSVIMGQLDNGLRYYIQVNHRPENRAELRLAVNAGSVLEEDNQRGIAHFVEHMAFNGTRHFARQALVNYLESIGMRFGADLNAYTSFDETVYMLTVPTDTGTFLQRGVEILRDWADGQVFDTAEVNRERGVVIEEWRLGRGAEQRMQDKQFPVLFRGSRYAVRIPIGLKEQLDKFTANDLRRFYQRWYRPDLMAVIAVGEFDPKAVERLIRDRFASIPRPQTPEPRPIYPVPPHTETLVAIATDPEATSSRTSVYYKQPLRREKTVADYRQSLVEQLYSSMFNDRFFEITQKPDAPFLYASTGQGRFVRSGEVYLLSACVKDGGIERGLAAVLTEAERVARYGFTPTELTRAKADLLRGLESAWTERDKTNSASYVSELARAFLEEEPVPGVAAEYQMAQALVPGITVDEINRLARAWMVDQNRVIVANEPAKTGLAVPTAAELLAVLNGAKQQTVEAYHDMASDAPLVAKTPAGSRIVEEKTIPELGLQEWRLANGVRVVLKSTDFKNDEILMSAWSPGGTSLAPDTGFIPASTASMVVSNGGVGSLSLVDLQKTLAGKEVGVRPVIGPLSEGLSGSASPKDLTTLFQLSYLYFTAPRRDTSAFLAMQQQLEALLQNRALSPTSVFQDTVQVTLAQHHPRVRPMTADVFHEMNLDRSLAFYRDRFADASDFIFFFVGSFNPDSLKPLAQTWLGSLPSINRKETWRDVGIRPPAGVVKKAVYRGVEPKSQTEIIFTGTSEYTRQSRYSIRALADVLQIRLRERMRQDLGGTYSVGVRGGISRDPDSEYSFSVSFGSAPERVDELVKAAFDEIQKLKDSGATEVDIAKVKEIQRRTRETSSRQNGFWLGQLEASYREGVDPRDLLTYDRLVDSLSSTMVRDAARKYLPSDHYVQASLFPEKPKS